MSADFDARLSEWVTWAFEHKDDGGDLGKQVAYLKKALEGTLELLANAAHDIRMLEQRPENSRALYHPGQLHVRGDLRRFG